MKEFSFGEQSPSTSGVEMTREATLAFLTARGTGVLSLAGDPPYSLPMSFAVDSSAETLVFQSLSGPDAEKDSYLENGVGASLVTFEWSSPDNWASAVVTGELSSVEGTPDQTAAFARQADSVGLSAFGVRMAELDAAWYELDPGAVTGRRGPEWTDGNTFGETR
jgi:nitroimidazol reductase NimA-like FMN-containing flavoprotein (pyridoxamine 5'-phosphate oxidase superfamily)